MTTGGALDGKSIGGVGILFGPERYPARSTKKARSTLQAPGTLELDGASKGENRALNIFVKQRTCSVTRRHPHTTAHCRSLTVNSESVNYSVNTERVRILSGMSSSKYWHTSLAGGVDACDGCGKQRWNSRVLHWLPFGNVLQQVMSEKVM